MKIAINCCSFLKEQHTGIGRYAANLVTSLSMLDRDNEYVLYVKKSIFNRKKIPPQMSAHNFSVKVDYLKCGLRKLLRGVDLYHSPSLDFIPVTPGSKTRTIVTIHDCIHKAFPEGHTELAVRTSESKMQDVISKASHLICVSQHTREDVLKYYSIPPDRVDVIPHGIDHTTFYAYSNDERVQSKALIQKKEVVDPYILFVGTIEPRKNLTGVIRAFSAIKRNRDFSGKLVVIGMKGWLQSSIYPLIKELSLTQDIIFLDYVTTEELCSFYNHACVFVYPSLYEGFGFPILEAFSCGAPVVTSNTTSCQEIASDAALTVDPHDTDAMAVAITRLLKDERLKETLIEKGFLRAKEFSLTKTAEQTLAVYQKVISGPLSLPGSL